MRTEKSRATERSSTARQNHCQRKHRKREFENILPLHCQIAQCQTKHAVRDGWNQGQTATALPNWNKVRQTCTAHVILHLQSQRKRERVFGRQSACAVVCGSQRNGRAPPAGAGRRARTDGRTVSHAAPDTLPDRLRSPFGGPRPAVIRRLPLPLHRQIALHCQTALHCTVTLQLHCIALSDCHWSARQCKVRQRQTLS